MKEEKKIRKVASGRDPMEWVLLRRNYGGVYRSAKDYNRKNNKNWRKENEKNNSQHNQNNDAGF